MECKEKRSAGDSFRYLQLKGDSGTQNYVCLFSSSMAAENIYFSTWKLLIKVILGLNSIEKEMFFLIEKRTDFGSEFFENCS